MYARHRTLRSRSGCRPRSYLWRRWLAERSQRASTDTGLRRMPGAVSASPGPTVRIGVSGRCTSTRRGPINRTTHTCWVPLASSSAILIFQVRLVLTGAGVLQRQRRDTADPARLVAGRPNGHIWGAQRAQFRREAGIDAGPLYIGVGL